MSYSKDPEAIRHGFVNYIGALIDSAPYSPEEAKHSVVATLLEECLSLSKEESSYNLFVAKPILRACVNLISSQAQALSQIEDESIKKNAQFHIKQYQQVVCVLKSLCGDT